MAKWFRALDLKSGGGHCGIFSGLKWIIQFSDPIRNNEKTQSAKTRTINHSTVHTVFLLAGSTSCRPFDSKCFHEKPKGDANSQSSEEDEEELQGFEAHIQVAN